MNWISFTVVVFVGVIGSIALIVGQNDMATFAIGALVGLLSPTPYKQ